jgi:hypothetical protein
MATQYGIRAATGGGVRSVSSRSAAAELMRDHRRTGTAVTPVVSTDGGKTWTAAR